jgi:hypothetical protein
MLPPPLPRCRRLRRRAAATAELPPPPPLPSCRRRHRRQDATAATAAALTPLPPTRFRLRRRRAAATAAAAVAFGFIVIGGQVVQFLRASSFCHRWDDGQNVVTTTPLRPRHLRHHGDILKVRSGLTIF